jgi:hypothetical protein
MDEGGAVRDSCGRWPWQTDVTGSCGKGSAAGRAVMDSRDSRDSRGSPGSRDRRQCRPGVPDATVARVRRNPPGGGQSLPPRTVPPPAPPSPGDPPASFPTVPVPPPPPPPSGEDFATPLTRGEARIATPSRSGNDRGGGGAKHPRDTRYARVTPRGVTPLAGAGRSPSCAPPRREIPPATSPRVAIPPSPTPPGRRFCRPGQRGGKILARGRGRRRGVGDLWETRRGISRRGRRRRGNGTRGGATGPPPGGSLLPRATVATGTPGRHCRLSRLPRLPRLSPLSVTAFPDALSFPQLPDTSICHGHLPQLSLVPPP